MASKFVSFVLFIYFFSFISPTLSSLVSSGIEDNCNKTPYPKLCKSTIMEKNPKHFAPINKSQFRKMALQVALDGAFTARSHNKWLGQKCRNKKEKAAWADCLKLYQDTILQLNKTLEPNTKCTDFDARTWLSTALTNLETCRNGFIELGVSEFMLPLMSNNVSKHLSNILSTYNTSVVPQTYKDGFPSWVNAGDRKLLRSSSPTPNLVVAQDGSGNYKTIKAALDHAAATRRGSSRFVIHVKRGVYNEIIEIDNKMKNIMLVGGGLRRTIITARKSVGGGSTTFNSATFAVNGEGFIAHGITFRNDAGPENHQAVAFRSGSDRSVLYRCAFVGYQDTLYVHAQRQFYKECFIFGTVDFIFGNAAVVFQNCMIYARKPMANQKNTITAQGRTDPYQTTGISIQKSRVMAAADLTPALSQFKTYLGRPWKKYSRTVFLQTYIGSLVDPDGWLEWDGDFALNTFYYGEYKNMGPGSLTNRRVKWGGYRVLSANEASMFTVENFILGGQWLPATRVPFTSTL